MTQEHLWKTKILVMLMTTTNPPTITNAAPLLAVATNATTVNPEILVITSAMKLQAAMSVSTTSFTHLTMMSRVMNITPKFLTEGALP